MWVKIVWSLRGNLLIIQLSLPMKKIIIPKEDEYSANCIQVNDYVIIPAGYLETNRKLNELGYKTIELDMSEFRKHDGGLSCLSLRF